MKAFLVFGFALSLIFLSCSSDSSDSSGSYAIPLDNEPIVCVFYGINGLGDLTYNDKINQGVVKAESEFNFFKISYSPQSWTAAESYMNYIFGEIQKSSISRGNVLCIFVDPYYLTLLEKNELFAKNLPITTLFFNMPQSVIPESIRGKVNSVFIPYYGACYAAGKLAKTISGIAVDYKPYIILADEGSSILFEYSQFFLKGFGLTPPASISEALDNKSSDFDYLFLSQEITKLLSGKESGYDMADLLYRFGSTVGIASTSSDTKYIMFPLCGGSTLGLLHYADDAIYPPYNVIGFDVDMSLFAPSAVPFSVLVAADKVVFECIEQWQGGKLPKSQIKTFEQGYTSIYVPEKDVNLLETIRQEGIHVENAKLLEIAENVKS